MTTLTASQITTATEVSCELKSELLRITGKPEILPLTERELKSERRIRKLSGFFRSKNERSRKGRVLKKYSGSWGLLTDIILKGRKDNPSNAIRFGHFELMSGCIQRNSLSIISIFNEIFRNKETAFPWLNGKGEITYDFRLKRVDFGWAELKVLKGEVSDHNFQSEGKGPLIVYADSEKSGNDTESLWLMVELQRRPFLIFLKSYSTGGGMATLGHMICNHEYIDGLPAAYYLSLFMRKLGLKQVNPGVFSDAFLKQVFNEADLRERTTGSHSFFPVTHCMGKEWTQKMTALHQKVSSSINPFGLQVSLDVFVQLFLLSVYMDQPGIRGTVLRFSPYASEQIDFYDVSDAAALFQAVIDHPEHLRSKFSGYLIKEKHIGLFVKGKNVVGTYIEPLVRRLPIAFVRLLSGYARRSGASRAMIGQVVVTGVPPEIRINDRNLNLGLGFGGPACAEFQDAAVTFGWIKDDTGKIADMVIRTKFREYSRKG